MGIPSARRLSGPWARRLLGCPSAGAIIGTGERLGSDHVGVPWVGREDLRPAVLAPRPRPVDTDLRHGVSSPRRPPHPVGPVAGSPALMARLFGNGTDARLRGASPEGACRV